MYERPDNAESRCRKQSCPAPCGSGTWFGGTCALTGRLVVALLCLLTAGTAGAQHSLEPVDTSSPRAMIESFLAFTEKSAHLLSEYRDSPSPATQNALWHHGDEAGKLFDLSQVSPAARREVGVDLPAPDAHPARVRAIGFGSYSLDLDLFAYVNTKDWNDFLAVQEDVILRIMDTLDYPPEGSPGADRVRST